MIIIPNFISSSSSSIFQSIQSQLNFDHWKYYPQFQSNTGLGRTALIGTILGIIWGIHFIIWIQLILYQIFHVNTLPLNYNINVDASNIDITTQQQQQKQQKLILFMLCQWCSYILCLCTFHILEFFITAIYNPTQVTCDSYLINHSLTYTIAAMTSWMEFWFRFICIYLQIHIFDYMHISNYIPYIGFVIVVLAQYIRSMAMATAGESFNHNIQTSKKHNHILITHGIYHIFRHPSYVGFFYWSISTQLLLGNLIHIILYTIASWIFFNRRIQYEEESLYKFFPNTYPQYVSQTYMGIPFIKSKQNFVNNISTVVEEERNSTSSSVDEVMNLKKAR